MPFIGGDDMLRKPLQPALHPGEELVGVVMATRRAGLLPQTVAVGVTSQRLIIAPVAGKKSADVVSLDRADITGSSASAMGVDWRKLSGSNVSKLRIDSRTHGQIKMSLIGDDLAELAVRGGPSPGVAALYDFLTSAR